MKILLEIAILVTLNIFFSPIFNGAAFDLVQPCPQALQHPLVSRHPVAHMT
jgi:hypothetical protein